MTKFQALLLSLVVLVAPFAVASSASAAPTSEIPLCEGSYPYYNCKTVTETYGPEGSAGPLYVITYVYNSQGKGRLVQGETTLPKR